MATQLALYWGVAGEELEAGMLLGLDGAGLVRPVARSVVTEPYPPAYEDDDRVVFEAITVCCVCGRPVEPRTEQEYEAYETLGVHLGECWHALKRDLARLPSPRRIGA